MQAAQAAAAQAAQVPLPPNFALAPALLDQANPWDYSTREGQNIYKAACAPLPYTFQGKKSSLPAYLKAIQARADQFGWHDILEITIGQDAQGNDINRSLLEHYGEITLQQVRNDADYIGTASRNAQMSHQMFHCLHNTNDTDSANRMVTESDKYMINGTPDGPSYLATLIQTFFVTTDAKPTQIRLKIAEAHKIIAERDYDIDLFNTEINSYVQQLHALGTTTQDLFAHLTKAYKSVPDKAFNLYINSRINAHDDGTNRMTAEQFMSVAKTKYDEMITDGIWMTQDDTDKQLVALTAQLEQVEIKNKNLQAKVNQNKPQSRTYNNNRRTGQSSSNKWKWKDIPPKSGQTTKKFEGKTYNWCPHHKKWTLHKPSVCRLKDRQQNPGDGNKREKQQAGYQAYYDDDWDGHSQEYETEQEAL